MTEMRTDLAIVGGNIFDGVRDAPFRGAVLIRGDRIEAVVPGDGARACEGAARVIDAGGRLVMPGFFDSHVHLIMAGVYHENPSLLTCASARECAEAVKRAADGAGGRSSAPTGAGAGDWVFGFGWYPVFWEDKAFPDRAALDRLFPDRPVLLVDAEAHGVWVNTVALALAGVTKDTPDPVGGEILRRADGEPTGVLLETAAGLATRLAFDLPPEKEKAFIRSYMRSAAAYGITSINDVMPYFHGDIGTLSVYSEMDRAGELRVRIHAAPDLLGDLDKVLEDQRRYGSDRLRVASVKAFLDGVASTHTAAMLEDYADAAGVRGCALFDWDAIRRAVPEAHRRGLSVKLHTCGDASLRFGLDCFEEAVRLHGPGRARHTLEHCEVVDAADIPRFGALGVIPSVQPEHIALTQTFAANPYRTVLGEARAMHAWPLRSLLASAGALAFGSDCPVVDDNPFLEIYRAVTRVHNDGEPRGGWNPAEKLTLAEALRMYTWGSAYAAGREHELGTLEAGKFADIAIMDRDLFAASVEEIREARVDCTIMGGRVVFERQQSGVRPMV